MCQRSLCIEPISTQHRKSGKRPLIQPTNPNARQQINSIPSAIIEVAPPVLAGPFYSWWRWGESNPRPMRYQHRHLRAQPAAKFRTKGLCWPVSQGPSQLSLDSSVLTSRTRAPCIALPGSGEAGTPRADRRLI